MLPSSYNDLLDTCCLHGCCVCTHAHVGHEAYVGHCVEHSCAKQRQLQNSWACKDKVFSEMLLKNNPNSPAGLQGEYSGLALGVTQAGPSRLATLCQQTVLVDALCCRQYCSHSCSHCFIELLGAGRVEVCRVVTLLQEVACGGPDSSCEYAACQQTQQGQHQTCAADGMQNRQFLVFQRSVTALQQLSVAVRANINDGAPPRGNKRAMPDLSGLTE